MGLNDLTHPIKRLCYLITGFDPRSHRDRGGNRMGYYISAPRVNLRENEQISKYTFFLLLLLRRQNYVLTIIVMDLNYIKSIKCRSLNEALIYISTIAICRYFANMQIYIHTYM